MSSLSQTFERTQSVGLYATESSIQNYSRGSSKRSDLKWFTFENTKLSACLYIHRKTPKEKPFNKTSNSKDLKDYWIIESLVPSCMINTYLGEIVSKFSLRKIHFTTWWFLLVLLLGALCLGALCLLFTFIKLSCWILI